MDHPTRIAACAALVLFGVGLSFAVGAEGTLDLGGGYAAQVNARGVVRIRRNGTPVVREVFLGTWVDGKFVDQLKAIKVTGDERGGLFARRGVIPRPGASAKYEVFVRAAPPDARGLRDLLLTYVVETPLFPKAKAAVLVRFPIAEYAGKSVLVDGRPAGTFPAKQGPKPQIASRRGAHDVLVAAAGKPVVFLGRQDPGEVLVQDSRRWGAGAYEAQFHLMPTRSEPASRQVLTLLLSFAGKRGPTLAALTTNRPPAGEGRPPALPTYGMFEVRMDLWARYDNPYDAADIQVSGLFTQPDGKIKVMRGFLYQDFRRGLVRGREVLTPVGPRQWRVRFTPTREGKHSYVIAVKTKHGTLRTKPREFVAAQSDAPGYISIHRRNRKYFQFSNGRTCFLVGHNACWGSEKKLSYDYDTYFRRMSHASENYTRVWMCSWDTGIEGPRLDHYRLDAAWRLDYILQLAERRGIYVKLCLDNELDYSTREGKRKLFGYWKENGGPCAKVMDFFTLPSVKAAYKRRLDYLLARWGYSPHILAWELWNEMNYLASAEADAREILVAWTEEMAAYLKDHDPYRHLVTTSLGLLTTWDEIWELRDIDFAQIHCYLPKPDLAKRPEEQDAVLAVLRAGDRVARYGKPYLISEFGYLDLHKINRTNEKDRGGVHLHNAVWGALFSGAAGTPAIWWWKDYVHDKNLYYHYASAARFLHGIDLADKNWKQVVTAAGGKVRILGIKKSDQCALWIQRRGNHWYRRVVEEKPPVPLGKIRVRIADVEPGKYRVTWWDPYGLEITSYPQRTVRSRSDPRKFDLVLEYKTGAPDIAVKARKVQSIPAP